MVHGDRVIGNPGERVRGGGGGADNRTGVERWRRGNQSSARGGLRSCRKKMIKPRSRLKRKILVTYRGKKMSFRE